jgi:phage major head subunit gpT-like protein
MELITSRAIIGAYFLRLEQNIGASWVGLVSNYFISDQSSETYAWLTQSPQMQEWVDGRHAKGFTENGITIKNLHFEATIEFKLRDLRRDKTGQVMVRVNDMADRTNAHWAKLLSTLILNGATTVSYDGKYFFATDHAEKNSGIQSNKISVDISALPTQVHGVTTAPSVEEMQQAILQGIAQIKSFKDDQGELMNEGASQFLVMVPTSLWLIAEAATKNTILTSNAINLIPGLVGIQIGVAENARLNTWTDRFVILRTDGNIKPLIRQEEEKVQLKAKAEGSEFEFDNDAHQYGVDTWRNAGTGLWQGTCQVILT